MMQTPLSQRLEEAGQSLGADTVAEIDLMRRRLRVLIEFEGKRDAEAPELPRDDAFGRTAPESVTITLTGRRPMTGGPAGCIPSDPLQGLATRADRDHRNVSLGCGPQLEDFTASPGAGLPRAALTRAGLPRAGLPRAELDPWRPLQRRGQLRPMLPIACLHIRLRKSKAASSLGRSPDPSPRMKRPPLR